MKKIDWNKVAVVAFLQTMVILGMVAMIAVFELVDPSSLARAPVPKPNDDTSGDLPSDRPSMFVAPLLPPAIVIVLVAPVPDATTPEPTKLRAVAAVDKLLPSSCTVKSPAAANDNVKVT